jgi:hypothetical protein
MMMVISCNGPKKRNQDQTASVEVFGFKPKEALKGDSMGHWLFKIADANSRGRTFSAFVSIKGVASVRKIERDSNAVDVCLEN